MKRSIVSLLGILLIGISFNITQGAEGGVNQAIPYSGTIYDSSGQLMPDGEYHMVFRIYDQALGGNPLWEEEHGNGTYQSVVCPEVLIDGGRYDVFLGSCTGGSLDPDGGSNPLLPLNQILNNTELYLEVGISDAQDGNYNQVFSPRKRIGSAVSSFTALKLVADGDGASTAELLIESDGELQFVGDDNGVFTMSDSASANGYTFMSIVDATSQALITLAGAGDGFAYSAVNLSNADQTRTWSLQHRSDSVFNNLNSFFIQEFDGTNYDARLTIKPGGNVGIGTGQPGYRLEVAGTIFSSSGGFRFPDGTTQTTAATGGGGGSSLWTANGSDIYYNSGRVGIGTTTPAELLHVNTSGNFGTIRFDAGNGSTGGYVFADQQFGFVVLGSRTNTYTRLVRGGAERIGFDSSEVVINQNGDANNFRVEGDTQQNMIFGQASTGRVGIGTNSPGYPLTVVGTIHSTTGGFRFPDGTTQTTAATGGGGSLWTQSGSNIWFGNQFTGNVGIGTNNPTSAKLVVNGSINSTGSNSTFTIGSAVRFDSSGLGTSYIGSNMLYGGLGVGTNSPSAMLDVAGDVEVSGDLNITGMSSVFTIGSEVQVSTTFSGDTYFGTNMFGPDVGIGTNNPGYKLQVGSSGDGTQARANAWNTFSDARWKRDLEVVESALAKVSDLNGYYYFWNSGADSSRQFGFIAQEVQQVLPEIVTSDDEGYLSLDYAKLTPLLVEAVKELDTKVELIDSGFDPSVLASESITLAGLTVTGDGRIAGDLTIEGILTAEGGIRTGVRTINSNQTLLASDSFVSANAGENDLTLTLPTSTAGHEIILKKVDTTTNIVTITAESGTIDGKQTVVLETPYEYLRVIHDAENWYIIGSGTESSVSN